MVGSTINPIVTVVAPTIPFAAASSTPTASTAIDNPPVNEPNSRAMVSSKSSAMRERSSITPMKTNSGIAISTSLVTTPKTRGGNANNSEIGKMPNACPTIAKISDTPPSVSATG